MSSSASTLPARDAGDREQEGQQRNQREGHEVTQRHALEAHAVLGKGIDGYTYQFDEIDHTGIALGDHRDFLGVDGPDAVGEKIPYPSHTRTA